MSAGNVAEIKFAVEGTDKTKYVVEGMEEVQVKQSMLLSMCRQY